MMYLGLPQIDHDSLIDELVDDRQNGVNAEYFESIRVEWKARARFYIEQRGNPESIAPWGLVGEYGGTLKNLYSSRNVDDVQVPVIKTLRGRTLQMCPFCGENGAPQTLDHYLPKDSFPEFAAIPANLAPMCDACQEGKATKTVDPDLQRYFLHPYFDEMAAHQMITLSIHEPYSAPEGFELRPLPILAEEWISLVQRHLKELGVEGRFSKYFDDQYVRLLRQVQDVRAENEDVRTMIKQFAGMNRRRSRNCWDHVFYAGVLANPALMTFLESGDLPLNL